MIDATKLKAHRTASSLRGKGDLGRLIGRTKGGMNPKPYAIADAIGRPLSFFAIPGHVSDCTGVAALRNHLRKAQWLLGNRHYGADC